MSSSPRQSQNDSGLGSSRRSRLDGKRWSLATAFTNSKKPSNLDTNAFPGNSPSFVDPVINDLQQLHKYTLKIKNAAKNVHHVDSAWNDYIKHKEKCFEWCKVLITPSSQRRQSSVVSPTTLVPPPPKSEFRRDPSLDTLNLVTVDTGSSTQSSGSRADPPLRPSSHDEQCQKAAHEWENTIELLATTLRTSLLETYNEYDKDASPEGFEKLCTDKAARRTAIYHMRNASISKMMSADLDFFPKYDIRFRNYDEIKKDLAKMRSLLGASGIPQNRTIIERCISPRGDAMLEFANLENEAHPVFRFRVASDCLRETPSPIFRHMFGTDSHTELDDDIRRSLPLLPPTRYVCSDGSEVKLYRMPQTELDYGRSLQILLHAAHGHHDKIPEHVRFSLFTSIAEACLRYRCTSPLELTVEHRWLPYWRDHAEDNKLEEALLISYVFGLSENFTRLSRIAILDMTDAESVQCKSWPQKVEEKIAAVRNVKIQQVYEQCRTTLNEFLFPNPAAGLTSSTDRSHANLSSGLRCPRGDRTCDAQNLGWYMKSLNELGILAGVMPSPAILGVPAPQTQSLSEVIRSLCSITSPPSCHGGICDFAPAFQAAIRDIYESVSGLTLFDVSGKPGWALSKNRSPRHSVQSQNNGSSTSGAHEKLFKIAQQRYEPRDHHNHHNHNHYHYHRSSALPPHASGRSGSSCDEDDGDTCYFKILSLLDDPRDLRAAALINKRFYRSYLRNFPRLREGVRGKMPAAAAAAAQCRDGDIAEVDGSPYRLGTWDSDDSGVGIDAVPRGEKFQLGQVLLVENKRLVEGDTNKYAGAIRTQLNGLRTRGGEVAGQSAYSIRY
ncbi:hypothetical protein GGR51DRAFT_499314 [Nemania sp. FL0031]|nr:hypothetical protein GGR51DRAFT_499314 [Nemania sp. FL0031]